MLENGKAMVNKCSTSVPFSAKDRLQLDRLHWRDWQVKIKVRSVGTRFEVELAAR